MSESEWERGEKGGERRVGEERDREEKARKERREAGERMRLREKGTEEGKREITLS